MTIGGGRVGILCCHCRHKRTVHLSPGTPVTDRGCFIALRDHQHFPRRRRNPPKASSKPTLTRRCLHCRQPWCDLVCDRREGIVRGCADQSRGESSLNSILVSRPKANIAEADDRSYYFEAAGWLMSSCSPKRIHPLFVLRDACEPPVLTFLGGVTIYGMRQSNGSCTSVPAGSSYLVHASYTSGVK